METKHWSSFPDLWSQTPRSWSRIVASGRVNIPILKRPARSLTWAVLNHLGGLGKTQTAVFLIQYTRSGGEPEDLHGYRVPTQWLMLPPCPRATLGERLVWPSTRLHLNSSSGCLASFQDSRIPGNLTVFWVPKFQYIYWCNPLS